MNIRVWQKEDILSMAALEKRTFPLPRSFEEFMREYVTGLAEYVVCKKNGELLGYGGFYHVLDEGYVTNIAVDEKYRRQGIGRGIVEAMLLRGRARNISFLSLETRKSNTAAQALYEGMGFRRVGERRSFYENPTEDAYLYTYTLSGEENL
jgi:ribosomal-protein-alanine N-acetyltransferase